MLIVGKFQSPKRNIISLRLTGLVNQHEPKWVHMPMLWGSYFSCQLMAQVNKAEPNWLTPISPGFVVVQFGSNQIVASYY